MCTNKEHRINQSIILQWRDWYGVPWQNFLYSLEQLGSCLTCKHTTQYFNRDHYGKKFSLMTVNLDSHANFSVIDQILQQVKAGELINKFLVVCEGVTDWVPRNDPSWNVNRLNSGVRELDCAHLIWKLKKERKDLNTSTWAF